MSKEIAILMAAGLGSRMKPLTDITAKPLIAVNGKPLIETVIAALQKRGVEEVYVVVGYKKEQFEPLKAKYPFIQLVENPEYDTKNNINSIAVVADKMASSDCFICEADLYIADENLLCHNLDKSGYFGKMVLGESDDWVFDTENGLITRVGKVGTDAYNMVGLSYFKQTDAKQIAEAVVKYVQDPAWAQKFWDDVVNELVRTGLGLVVHDVQPGSIIECDTVEDLKALEKSLSTVRKRKTVPKGKSKYGNVSHEVYNLTKYGVWECPDIEIASSLGSAHVVKLHTHNDCLELCYLEQGRRVYVDEKRSCVMHGGNVWCNLPGLPHTSMGRPCGASKFYCMHLKAPRPETTWCGLDYDEAMEMWNFLQGMTPDKMTRANEGLKTILDFMFSILRNPEQVHFNAMIKISLRSVMGGFMASQMVSTESFLGSEKIQEIVAQINDTPPTEHLEVTKLVKQYGLTPSYFVNTFQRIMGMTPGQYVLSRRLESAARKIAAGEDIQKVSDMYNFSSRQHFTTAFRKYFLETPLKYRKRAKSKLRSDIDCLGD